MRTHPISRLFRKIDPTYDSLFRALYLTLPALLAGFYSLYSLRPFSETYVLLAAFIFLGINTFSIYKDKLIYIMLSLLLLELLQFMVNILILHPTVIIVCVFIIIFPVLAVNKFRSPCLAMLVQTTLVLNGSGGIYQTLNGVIGISVMGIMVVFCMMLFEYCFSKIRMRAHLLYLLELLADAFNLIIFSDEKQSGTHILNKHLSTLPLNYRADFSVEPVFSSRRDIFLHRLLTQLTSSNKVIVNEEYYFQKNLEFQNKANLGYFQCRKLFRELGFITAYLKNEAEIQLFLPNNKALMNNINNSFNIIYKAIKTQEAVKPTLDSTLINLWLADVEKLKTLYTPVLDKELFEFIYGIKCLIADIKKFEEIFK